MMFSKKILAILVIFGIIGGATVFYASDIQDYFENKRLRAEILAENKIQKVKFKKEYERMTTLTKQSHEKCPIHYTLKSNYDVYNSFVFKNSGKGIPAYSGLSAIYVHVLPPMKWLSSTLVKAIEESLAFCGKNKEPVRVILIDISKHKNLEQEDALTLIISKVKKVENWGYGASDYTIVPQLGGIKILQYIPRWNIFPNTYRKVLRDGKISQYVLKETKKIKTSSLKYFGYSYLFYSDNWEQDNNLVEKIVEHTWKTKSIQQATIYIEYHKKRIK